MRLFLLVLICLSASFPALNQERTERERPAVTKIGKNLYRLGEIEIDAEARTITFPVVVNMREGGPIEYILVHEHGKVHESILTTSISPLNLSIALKLLKFEDGYGDVFNLLLPPELLETEGGTEAERGDGFYFDFLPDGKSVALRAEDLILDGITGKPMDGAPWIFTGSKMENEIYMAESEGSVVAIYLDYLAIFNMTIDGADTDERWGANSNLIPEIGTQGKFVIRAAED